MREIKISFFINSSHPVIKYEKFPDCYSDYDIDDWCYDIIEREFGNNGSFMWEEFSE